MWQLITGDAAGTIGTWQFSYGHGGYAGHQYTTIEGWLKETAMQMAVGSALSAVGGALSGALSGGLAVSGTAATGDVTDLAIITAKGARYANYATKLTARELQGNLLSNGYKIVRQGISSNGPFTVLSSGEKTYTIYTATSTGGPTAEVALAGRVVSKIRLGGY